ncbi:putative chromosome segregation protein [Elsinoe ampelina]|uniref:Putative chromosome segregation protein n=1 Tax=Elsinoe ampelina TaxID=302913 RepID=A0A6A6GBV6_9PEZI|nr:putative chromosome segregation protein [Elsinoe ampelina]
MASRIRARPAHAPGPTYTAYNKNGRKLITVGNNSVIRVFTTGSDAEPVNIDVPQEAHTALAAADDFFITGSEDGHVCKYSLETHALDEILLRSTLPIRDVAISPDGLWAAVASDELVVKMVNTRDMTQVLQLKEQAKPVKHVAFDHSGSQLAVSCTDGVVYVYSVSSEQPKLVKKLDGLIKMVETEAQASSAVIWHPDGRALAAPTVTRAVQVVSTKDWQNQQSFQSGHAGDITAVAWSHNGALLASAGEDRSLILWDTRTQEIIKKFEGVREPVLSIAWHPVDNIVSYTNNDGELYIHTDFVPSERASILEKALVAAPLRGEALSEISNNVQRPQTNGTKVNGHRARDGTPDSLDDLLDIGAQSEAGGDDFIDDDDGAGYAEVVNGHGKRTADYLSGPQAKRYATKSLWQPKVHPSFQPSSTPWRGNRRYLCLNLTGFVWTVDQDTHHTITVEFYDRALHRDFHFTDPFLYDRACLSSQGAAFTCPSTSRHGSLIYYRPHETWTARTDWRTSLPAGEEVTSLSLSSSYVTVTTSAGYVRVYTLFGVPFRVYRTSALPVTSTSWRDYLLLVSNGPVTATGATSLVYSIDNVKRDETHQNAALLPLPSDAELSSVFWSESGDPCVYDSTGVLLVCLHWRSMGQAKWVPLLDTTALERLQGGKKDEAYWPVAVAGDKFHCIILKGGEKYPYFPRPLLSEFDFEVPLGRKQKNTDEMETDDNEEDERRKLEERFVRETLLLELKDEYIQNTRVSREEKTDVARREVDVDKVLLQLLAHECREGEERGMRALEIVGLMRDRTGKMLEAAGKIAGRFGRDVLGEKILQLGERRLVGLRDEDEE